MRRHARLADLRIPWRLSDILSVAAACVLIWSIFFAFEVVMADVYFGIDLIREFQR